MGAAGSTDQATGDGKTGEPGPGGAGVAGVVRPDSRGLRTRNGLPVLRTINDVQLEREHARKRKKREAAMGVSGGAGGAEPEHLVDEWEDPLAQLRRGPLLGTGRAPRDLNMAGRKLKGMLPPPTVRSMAGVQALDLSDNPELSALPASFGSLVTLVRLDLARCGLTELPPSIGVLKNLISIDLSDNQLRELPPSFGELRQCSRLWLRGNRLADWPPVADMAELELLDVERNAITRVGGDVVRLLRLSTLILAANPLRDLPREFGRLKSLRRLSLVDCALRELPASFGMLDMLRVTWLQGNRDLEHLAPTAFSGLKSCQSLALSRTRVNAVPLQLPAGLLSFAQTHCGLVTVRPAVFESCRLLRDLDLSRNRLRELPAALGSLAQLRCLHVEHNELEALPASVGSLTSLRELYTHHNRLATLPPSIGGLVDLQRLDVSDCPVTHLPASFALLRRLEVLAMVNVQLHPPLGQGLTVDVQEEVLQSTTLKALRMDRALLSTLPDDVIRAVTTTVAFFDS